MGVEIQYVYCDEPGELEEGWCVIATQFEEIGDNNSILGPVFATERDAQVGLMALQAACGFDLNLPPAEFDLEWKKFGGRKQARKVMCEALQW